jgi:hypothetical protein
MLKKEKLFKEKILRKVRLPGDLQEYLVQKFDIFLQRKLKIESLFLLKIIY